MSRQGMIGAGQHATDLPGFRSVAEAEHSLFASRDRALKELFALPELQRALDYRPESLNLLEQWFFASGQPVALATGFSVVQAIGFYLGEVCCWHSGFKWLVQEFVLSPGHYELCVSRAPMTILLTFYH